MGTRARADYDALIKLLLIGDSGEQECGVSRAAQPRASLRAQRCAWRSAAQRVGRWRSACVAPPDSPLSPPQPQQQPQSQTARFPVPPTPCQP